jgi:hypothetical protein
MAGLVFPRFAASKAEMVAAGVIPIDRLTGDKRPWLGNSYDKLPGCTCECAWSTEQCS